MRAAASVWETCFVPDVFGRMNEWYVWREHATCKNPIDVVSYWFGWNRGVSPHTHRPYDEWPFGENLRTVSG